MITKRIRTLARATRRHELTWRYGFNLMPTLNQRLHQRRLSAQACRVLGELNRNGIAMTSVEELVASTSHFTEMGEAVDRLQENRRGDVARARANATDESGIGQKTFLLEYLGHNPILDPASVFARFALQYPVLDVANAYLGMYTQMRYYNVWHTFATNAKPRESQLWHRDREDLYILKVFLYLSDVDAGAGPFTYAPGTHRKGPIQREPAFFLEGRVKRTGDEEMAAVVPRESWLTAVGPRGTIVFADTHGYHKGGLARTSDRILYTCMFTSQASESEEFFVRNGALNANRRDARAFALSR
jgi:hypothetical protein